MANQRNLLLSDSWDIFLNSNGNIALTAGIYCDCQNVASAIRMFTKDAYLAQNQGIPHFNLDLGKNTPLSLIRSTYRKRAKQMENISNAVVDYLRIDTDTRTLTGRVVITNENGQQGAIEI